MLSLMLSRIVSDHYGVILDLTLGFREGFLLSCFVCFALEIFCILVMKPIAPFGS